MNRAASLLARVTGEAAALACGAAAGLAGAALWALFGSRFKAGDAERKRRLAVNSQGRTGNATITEVRETIVCYSYSLGGVNYTASQDVSGLSGLLPADLSVLIGPASFKYLPRNPANSIVVCEEWSGLRVPAGLAGSES
jgi:hypothetical protein